MLINDSVSINTRLLLLFSAKPFLLQIFALWLTRQKKNF
jgi:hypothetical protein